MSLRIWRRSKKASSCHRFWWSAETSASDVALQIADGYHRVCASYHTDENTDIPVKIVPAGD